MTFEGKGLTYFWNIYPAIYCAAAGWLIQSNSQAQYLIKLWALNLVRSFWSRYHRYHIFVHLCRVFRHSGSPLPRESYIFVQRRRFSSIDLIELRPERLSMLNASMFSLGFRALSRVGIVCINFLK